MRMMELCVCVSVGIFLHVHSIGSMQINLVPSAQFVLFTSWFLISIMHASGNMQTILLQAGQQRARVCMHLLIWPTSFLRLPKAGSDIVVHLLHLLPLMRQAGHPLSCKKCRECVCVCAHVPLWPMHFKCAGCWCCRLAPRTRVHSSPAHLRPLRKQTTLSWTLQLWLHLLPVTHSLLWLAFLFFHLLQEFAIKFLSKLRHFHRELFFFFIPTMFIKFKRTRRACETEQLSSDRRSGETAEPRSSDGNNW